MKPETSLTGKAIEILSSPKTAMVDCLLSLAFYQPTL
jgi:hypothetical protein